MPCKKWINDKKNIFWKRNEMMNIQTTRIYAKTMTFSSHKRKLKIILVSYDK